MLSDLVRAEGTGSLAYPHRLLRRDTSLRDLADAIHALVGVHAAHPGAVDAARPRWGPVVSRSWLDMASESFDVERRYLVSLCAATGPLPSTPGQAESAAALACQRSALATLVQSERVGCAMGAALMIVLDWHAIRRILDTGAERVGFPVPAMSLPDAAATQDALSGFDGNPSVERAAMFGARQVLAQHRGLWDLLEARASARAA